MPQPHNFGTEISGNARKRPNLTPHERSLIINLHGAGVSIKELTEQFRRDERTIRRTLKNSTTRPNTQELPRSGRPPILSRHQIRILYRKVRKYPKIQYKSLQEAVVVVGEGTPNKPTPSKSTIYRAIIRMGLGHHRCKKRPKLTQIIARKRLNFSREWRNFLWSRRTVKFSDECSVQKGLGHHQEWCFRFNDEKWATRMITEVPKSRSPSQMVWGAIWLDNRGKPRRSPLVIMERDPNASKGGYTAQSYIKTLEKGLLPHWSEGQLFQQDNAPIHTATATTTWFESHGITPIKWPPYSPDLNPIEHMWWWLKRNMHVLFPHYDNFSTAWGDWDGFCDALKEAWRQIPSRIIKALIMSMPRRIVAVSRARGWHTKY